MEETFTFHIKIGGRSCDNFVIRLSKNWRAKRVEKKALEAYWSNSISEDELHAQLKEIRLNHLRKQKKKQALT